jgi:hypothetical protein
LAKESFMWSRELCFFGRWDLRGKERALTVNSGSYVKARFTGTSLKATFDLSLNQPHCECTKQGSYPTIAWRIDDGAWQEGELAASVTLAEELGEGAHTMSTRAAGRHRSWPVSPSRALRPRS